VINHLNSTNFNGTFGDALIKNITKFWTFEGLQSLPNFKGCNFNCINNMKSASLELRLWELESTGVTTSKARDPVNTEGVGLLRSGYGKRILKCCFRNCPIIRLIRFVVMRIRYLKCLTSCGTSLNPVGESVIERWSS